ncbi:MAG: hypothetical protein ACO21H_02735 [Sediminibacterium sp.]
MPTVSAKLTLVDSGANLIASLPIQGFEKIELSIEASDEETYTYDMRVYKIDSRFSGDRFQTYSLGLISEEALLNEGVRVAKTLKDKPDKIVKDLLEKYLKTKKTITVDPSVYNIVFNPGKKSPFGIIDSIKLKSVPQGGSVEPKTSAKKNKFGGGGSKTDVTSSVAPVSNADYTKTKGTSGYMFFENRNGYVFKSIDSLCSVDKYNGTSPVAVYTQENNDVGGPPTRKILDIDFVEEIDIMSKLRLGAFSSLICFYNYSTGKYEEHVYSLADSYDIMGHSGSQKGLPYGQKELSKYPTRIMSALLDHETWYNGTDIASPEKEDGATGSTTNFPDFQKYYMSQSIARVNSLINQTVKITVTGNPSLVVGDKIEIRIPNQIPSANRKEQPYDPEHSGIYLISEVNHAFVPKKKLSSTYLTLIRDSYGSPTNASKVQ